MTRCHNPIEDGNVARDPSILELVIDSANRKVIENQEIDIDEDEDWATITNAYKIRKIYRIISELPKSEGGKK